MKRDMNLIRLLLLETEGQAPKPDLSNYSEKQQVYHTALLIDAGLVDGIAIKDSSGEIQATNVYRLTWAGHEFLDAARNETVWQKTQENIKKTGVDVTISILKDLLTQTLKQTLGLP